MRWIGQYQVFEEIGRGAGGVVYRALDPAIGRPLAIKELRLTQLSPDEIREARQRFLREAQAVGNLRHENIVTLYQFLEERDSLYLVMEFVPGGSLLDAMRRAAPFTWTESVGIIRQVAAALDLAHARGIVHRDIKPGNILVSSEMINNAPVVKVTDFGIARVSSQTITMTGVSLGTPSYMAPEQIKGSKVDSKADQFSLGVLAYELLGRKLPFSGSSYQAVMFQIVNAEPAPLLETNPALPPQVDHVVRQALAKDSHRRFPSCGAFGEALDYALFPVAPATRRTTQAKSGVNKKLVVAGTVILATAATIYIRSPDIERHPVKTGGVYLPNVDNRGADKRSDVDLKTPKTPLSEDGTKPQNDGIRQGKGSEAGTSPTTGPEPAAADNLTASQPKESNSRISEGSVHPGSFADTKSRNEVWSAVETWSSYIRSGDVGQYRDCYSDRLTRFYNHTNVSSDEAEQMILGQMKKYSIRELTVSNPSFQDVGEGSLQVDYDKEYRFSGAGVRVNQGKVKASQVLKRAEAGTWKITAEFDREICWSTQMRDPARQSPPGTCP